MSAEKDTPRALWESSHYTVSGDAELIYVSDPDGRIVATCPTMADAHHVAAALNADLYDLVTLLQTAGWERRGAVGGHTTWIEP